MANSNMVGGWMASSSSPSIVSNSMMDWRSFSTTENEKNETKEEVKAEENVQEEAEKEEEEEEEEKELTIEEKLGLTEKKVTELEDVIKSEKDRVLRAYAEMENVRRIAKNDVTNAREYANQSFAKGLLDVADNLERALLSVDEQNVGDDNPLLKTLLEGVSMTDKELKKVFQKHGVSQYGSVGDVFDPELHDALFQYADPEKDAGTIGQVIKTGFMYKDRVLRPAQVGAIQG
jgi:molecular chaperone GrpE